MLVIAGLARGVTATVVERWSDDFGGEPVAMWRIASNDLVRSRVLREDYLEVLP